MDVFILGSKYSGKSVLAAGLYHYIVTKNIGYRDVTHSDKIVKEYLSILKQGLWPPRTNPGEVRPFKFIIKGLFDDSTLEFIDYGGEDTEDIYNAVLMGDEFVNSALSKIMASIAPNYFDSDFGNDTINLIRTGIFTYPMLLNICRWADRHGTESAAINRSQKLCFQIYSFMRIHQAKKVIFLLDGDKLCDHLNGKDSATKMRSLPRMSSLAEDFEYFQAVVSKYANLKKFCIVITKADMLDDWSNDICFDSDIRNRNPKQWYKLINENLHEIGLQELRNIRGSSIDLRAVCISTYRTEHGVISPVKGKDFIVWGYESLFSWINKQSLFGEG